MSEFEEAVIRGLKLAAQDAIKRHADEAKLRAVEEIERVYQSEVARIAVSISHYVNVRAVGGDAITVEIRRKEEPVK